VTRRRGNHAAPEEESGRGLFLVAALSTRWDWYLTYDPPGKVIWCELDAGPAKPVGNPEQAAANWSSESAQRM
jgi:hypothetical protein